MLRIRLNKVIKCPFIKSFPTFNTSFSILSMPGALFAFNVINRAVGMLRGGNNSESQREGGSSNDVQYLPAASTSSSAGSLPAANTLNGDQYKTGTTD